MRTSSPHIRTLAMLALLSGAGCDRSRGWQGWEDPPAGPSITGAGRLEGRVRDAAGSPVAGAFVTIDPSGTEAVTDADGRWSSARLSPGTCTVVVAAPGFLPTRSVEVEVEVGVVSEVDVALEPARVVDGLLRVVVFGPDGQPASGAEVVATGATTVTGTTDGEGEVTLGGLGGAPATITVDVPGRRVVPRTVEGVEVPALGGTDLALTLAGRGEPDDHTIGSRVCGLCHPDLAASWQDTAHAEATSPVSGRPAEAFDEGHVVALGSATATFGRDGEGTPTLLLEDATGARDTWPVSGFLGGELRGAIPWAERDGVAFPLPVAWRAEDERYPGLLDGEWIAGDRGPWLRTDDRFAYTGAPALEHSAEAACFACHVTGTTLEIGADGGVTMRGVSSPSLRWDEGAVSCEACHGAGETHSSGPLSEKPGSIVVPDDLGPDRGNDVCGRCHAATVGDGGLPFPWTATHGLFRPGDTLSDRSSSSFEVWPSGAARVPNGSHDELRASLHGEGGWNAACTDCHDPHGGGLRSDLRLSADDNGLCETCHLPSTFEGDPALAIAHGGHEAEHPEDPGQSGRCVGCHMPATAARLGFDATTGAGDLSSHLFVAAPPSESVAAFDAAGIQVLEPGSFVPDTCLACHAWNVIWSGPGFPGPAGDPSRLSTHLELQTAYEGMFP